MACETCRQDWEAQRLGKSRAETFDVSHPACECETVSMSEAGRQVDGPEMLARIITSAVFDADAKPPEILAGKMVAIYRAGFSFFRAGSKEQEVRDAIDNLLRGATQQVHLIGAAVVTCEEVRDLGAPDSFFCVYDTQDEQFELHADAVGKTPSMGSNTQNEKARQSRMKVFRNELQRNFILADNADELVQRLKDSGFALAN